MQVSVIALCVTVIVCGTTASAACLEKELRLSDVPLRVLTAATGAVDHIVIEEAAIIGEGVEAIYELEGEARGTEYEIYVTPAGEVLRVQEDD